MSRPFACHDENATVAVFVEWFLGLGKSVPDFWHREKKIPAAVAEFLKALGIMVTPAELEHIQKHVRRHFHSCAHIPERGERLDVWMQFDIAGYGVPLAEEVVDAVHELMSTYDSYVEQLCKV